MLLVAKNWVSAEVVKEMAKLARDEYIEYVWELVKESKVVRTRGGLQ